MYEQNSSFNLEQFIDDIFNEERFRRWELPELQVRQVLQAPKVENYPEAVRRLYQLYADRSGKKRYADKTPRYVSDIRLLSELFPESRFVHVIRDGRNVSLSIREDGRRNGPKRFVDIGEALTHWRTRVQDGMNAKGYLGENRYMEVRFEDILEDPEVGVRKICKFVDLPFDRSMFDYQGRAAKLAGSFDDPYLQRHLRLPPTKGLRDWRSEMTKSEMIVAELVAGDLLDKLDYDPFPSNLGAVPTVVAHYHKAALGIKSLSRNSGRRARRLTESIASFLKIFVG